MLPVFTGFYLFFGFFKFSKALALYRKLVIVCYLSTVMKRRFNLAVMKCQF